MRILDKQNKSIEREIEKIEIEIKEFNELLNNVSKSDLNNQINYNDYNRLNNLLSTHLESWEKKQDEINRIIEIKDKL